MSYPIASRSDFDAPDLRRLARHSDDVNQARRLLALAAIYAGDSRTAAAGLLDRKAPDKPPLLKEAHRQALVRMIEDGPIPAVHGVVH